MNLAREKIHSQPGSLRNLQTVDMKKLQRKRKIEIQIRSKTTHTYIYKPKYLEIGISYKEKCNSKT